MPVTIIEVESNLLITYFFFLVSFVAILVLVCDLFNNKKYKCKEENYIMRYILIGFVFMSFVSGYIIYDSPSEDVNIAYINTSDQEKFLLEGSRHKRKDLRDKMKASENRLLYKGHDLEKVIKGNKYYIFKLSQIKSDKETAEEIVERYNRKYNKNLTVDDFVFVKSD